MRAMLMIMLCILMMLCVAQPIRVGALLMGVLLGQLVNYEF